MGLINAPGIVTNGLTFAYDVNNYKSYIGPAIANQSPFLNQVGIGVSNGYTSTSSVVVENIPTLGTIPVNYNVIQNNYPAVSNNCCPSLFAYSNGFVALPSTLYTYAIVYKCDSGYTSANYMYRYEYTSNGGALTIEQGVHNDTNRVHLGNDWYWAWATFTTQATTNWFGYMGAFYYRYSTALDRLAVPRVLIAPGNYTALHPIYWPSVNSSITNTANLKNLVATDSVTTSNLTYSSSGTFTFDGVDDWIDLGTRIQLSDNFTLCAWIKDGNTGFVLDQGNIGTDPTGCLEWTNNGLSLASNNVSSVTADGTITTTVWNYVCCSFAAGTVKFYINGQLNSTKTATWSSFSPAGTTLKIGRRALNTTSSFSGRIDVLQIYNTVLSDRDVRQNFAALRGRFGV
jgi:hypothetical protein